MGQKNRLWWPSGLERQFQIEVETYSKVRRFESHSRQIIALTNLFVKCERYKELAKVPHHGFLAQRFTMAGVVCCHASHCLFYLLYGTIWPTQS